jgi:Fe(3+) dicitrate transport protein
MQIQNPNFKIDPDLADETGFNSDVGARGQYKNKLFFDLSVYGMFYNNRIGTTIETDTVLFSTYQYRTNVSAARTFGIESMTEIDWWKVFISDSADIRLSTFVNFSYNNAKYIRSEEPAFDGKQVELVPPIVLKTGLTFGTDLFSISYQYSYTRAHFSDATNSTSQANAVNGIIPTYAVMDLSGKVILGRFQIEAGVNNLANTSYFTRRAVAYPGPGIIPGTKRNFYLALQVKL